LFYQNLIPVLLFVCVTLSLSTTFHHFCLQIIEIASNALDTFKNDAKKMVVALVDMERAFVPPQHFIRLVQRR
jgi:hypothetical protein